VGNGKLPSSLDTESWNNTALHLATFLGFTRTVELLSAWHLTSGPYEGRTINITAKNKWGFTPSYQALNNAEMATAVPTTTMLLKFMNEPSQML
jgi:hypothetical protein